MIDMALALGPTIEIAHVQYYAWGSPIAALLPNRPAAEEATRIVETARDPSRVF
jgi:hypothetical protein